MTRAGLRLGRLFGVPLLLAPSWFLFALLIVVVFAPLVQRTVPGSQAYLVATGYAVLLLVSVLLHEVAHALAARLSGLTVTGIVLNVWGGHTTFSDRGVTPGRSLVIAVAGPLVNAAIALAAHQASQPVDARLADGLPGGSPVLALLLGALTLSNLLLAVFNLLPGLPLDGGHALEAVVWKATGDRLTGVVAASWVGRVLAVGVVASAIALPRLLGGPTSLTVVAWAALTGALLWQGASAGLQHAREQRRLPTLSVRELLRPAIAVDAGATVDEVQSAARAAVAGGVGEDLEVVLVTEHGVPVAVVDARAVRAVPLERRSSLQAGATARALPPRPWLPLDLAGEELVEAVSAQPGDHVVVDRDGTVRGVLHTSDVAAAVRGR